MPPLREQQDTKKSNKWKQQVERLRTKVWYQAVQVASGLASPYAIWILRQASDKLPVELDEAAIPVSAFYEENHVTSVVRFCFSKSDATLDTALERLTRVLHG